MPLSRPALLSKDLWPTLTKAAKNKQCQVAVAYVGKDAPRLLPMRKGSTLVCDFSRAALERGMTNPDAIRAYLDAGVEIHSWEGLHAKVFRCGDVAFVGSNNASSHSARDLTEAALQLSDPATVREVSNFVLSLRGSRVGPELVAKLAPFYRQPPWEDSSGLHSPRKTSKQVKIPVWIADVSEEATRTAEAQADGSRGKARRLLSKSAAFQLDWFEWQPDVPKSIREQSGEILMICGRGKKREIYAPARYLKSEILRDSSGVIVWVESPRSAKPIPLVDAVASLGGDFGKRLKDVDVQSLIRNSSFAERLRKLWLK